MDLVAYAVEAVIEERHWWFVGRRLLFSNILKDLALPPSAEILDVGTGTGTNLRMLRDLGFAHVTGLDQSTEAIRFCAEKGLGGVQQGDVCRLPFRDARFDLVLATDIIEHVDDDIGALREVHRVLKPSGRLLVTIPAFRLLWGRQDTLVHHKRRYRMPDLLEKLRSAGFLPDQHFYFNYLLFLPILAARQLIRRVGTSLPTECEINTKWLNRLLTLLFAFDVETAPRLRPPFGVSALAVATKL